MVVVNLVFGFVEPDGNATDLFIPSAKFATWTVRSNVTDQAAVEQLCRELEWEMNAAHMLTRHHNNRVQYNETSFTSILWAFGKGLRVREASLNAAMHGVAQ